MNGKAPSALHLTVPEINKKSVSSDSDNIPRKFKIHLHAYSADQSNNVSTKVLSLRDVEVCFRVSRIEMRRLAVCCNERLCGKVNDVS